jgi:hypothetical protein
MRIETEGVDDLFADIIASSVAVTLRMLRISRDTEPCKTRVRFKETINSVTMIIRNHCLAVTPFGHLHLTGKKIAKKGKPYRAIYEIRLLGLRGRGRMPGLPLSPGETGDEVR